MEDESKDSYLSLLSNIRSKPLIIEKIFSYSISRPNILYSLITKDKSLVKKLNEIFSKVPKYKSGLDKEFIDNLNIYSDIRDIFNLLEKEYQEIKNKTNFKYVNFKSVYKSSFQFSFLDFYLSRINIYLYNIFSKISKMMLNSLFFDFLSTKDSIILTFLPQKEIYLDGNYISYITRQNMNSQEENQIKQKINLVLLFDEHYFFNIIKYRIKLPNIEEIEVVFDKEPKELYVKHNHLLHIYLNNYLSKIEYLDNISKITFHNLKYEKDLYQSVLGYIFDGYYFEKNNDIKQQLLLMTNLKTVNIEMTFFYIYEKIKLYFYLYELFPLLNIYSSNKKSIPEITFSYYLINKILIINNNNTSLKSRVFLNFIEYMMNSENIEFIFIINHNQLIFEDPEEQKEKDKDKEEEKINLSKLREFTFINEKSEDIKNLINEFSFNQQETYRIYEGYNKDNNLIYYRIGETQIQSLDLIDLFKNNEILERIEFIKEKIVVNYNTERNNLQILNKGKNKNDILFNQIFYMPITVFSKFIKNQNNLTELTINKFDFSLQDIVNDKIQILTINYEKDDSTLEYKNTNKTDKLSSFPNLLIFNLGSKYKHINFLKEGEIPKNLKKTNLILKDYKHSNLIQKIRNIYKIHKKELNVEIIDHNNIDEETEEEEDNEEEEDYYEEKEKYYEIGDYL